MKLKLVKPAQGFAWFRQGLIISRHQPLTFVSLLGLSLSMAMVLIGLPVVGPLIVVGCMPAMWLGFMLATRRVLQGMRVSPIVLFDAFRGPDAPRRTLAQLGGFYVMATLLVMQLAQLVGPDPEALADVFDAAKDVSDVINNPMVQQDITIRGLLTIPVSLLFWHAPALILWAGSPVGKALFFSGIACWRNLGAFVMYGLSWGVSVILLGLLTQALVTLIPVPWVANVVTIVAGMWLASAFYASLYFTVVDCFEPTPPSAEPDQSVNRDTPTSGQA